MNKITKAIEQSERYIDEKIRCELGSAVAENTGHAYAHASERLRKYFRQSQRILIEEIIEELKTRQYMIQDGTDFNGGIEAGYRYVELMLREVIDKKQ